jgi:hypothetical protein
MIKGFEFFPIKRPLRSLFLCEKITKPLNNLSQFSSFTWGKVGFVAGRPQGWASEAVVLSVKDGRVMPEGRAPGYVRCVG